MSLSFYVLDTCGTGVRHTIDIMRGIDMTVRYHEYQSSKNVVGSDGKVAKVKTKHKVKCSDFSKAKLKFWTESIRTDIGQLKKFVTYPDQHDITKAKVIAELKVIMAEAKLCEGFLSKKWGSVPLNATPEKKAGTKSPFKKPDYS